MDSTQRILVTGTGGFIGFHLARLLLAEGARVQGYDGMTDYYDVALKQRRHAMLLQHEHFTTKEALLEDRETFDALADDFQPDMIVHLAAQPAVFAVQKGGAALGLAGGLLQAGILLVGLLQHLPVMAGGRLDVGSGRNCQCVRYNNNQTYL